MGSHRRCGRRSGRRLRTRRAPPDAFSLGEEPTRCGDLQGRPSWEDYERVRACAIAAQRDRKAFTAVWPGPTLDSVIRYALAARNVNGRYEVRAFAYDSCPSGCGSDDPAWSSARCAKLVDLRVACSTIPRGKPPDDDGLRAVCDPELAGTNARYRLGLYCSGQSDPRVCLAGGRQSEDGPGFSR